MFYILSFVYASMDIIGIAKGVDAWGVLPLCGGW
jgi:hypothetical protein